MGWTLLHCAETICARNRTSVEADPDIAGIGIIVGFLSTTCLAFLVAFTVLFLHHFEDVVNFFRRRLMKQKLTYEQNQHHGGPYWRSVAFWARFTAMIKHCSMSVYHFRIVVDLAFLTTVTHLLTVVALRDYFVNYKWINLPRIVFMLANLALLGYTSFVAYSYDLAQLELSDSLACFFHQDRPHFSAAFGGKWAALLIGAIGGHAAVIAAMYWLQEPDPAKKDAWWYWIWYGGALVRTWLVAPVYAIYGVYMASDGLSETQALGNPPKGITIVGNESAWNFGQFLPVLLLALPIFAGWESFWEEKDEDRENRFMLNGARKSRITIDENSLEMVHQQQKVTYSGRSRDASREEQRVESSGPSPAITPRPNPQASPHLRSTSEGILNRHPALGL